MKMAALCVLYLKDKSRSRILSRDSIHLCKFNLSLTQLLLKVATAVTNRRYAVLDWVTYATMLVEANELGKFITSQQKLTTVTLKMDK